VREAVEEGQNRVWWKRFQRGVPEHLARRVPNSSAVQVRLFMPAQGLCFKHAQQRFNTTWMLLLDTDEFLRGDVLRLLSIMQARLLPPSGLWISQLQMTNADECLTPYSQHRKLERKHLVRIKDLHPDGDFFGSVHDLVLAPGTHSADVTLGVVAVAHFRYRDWKAVGKKARLAELGCGNEQHSGEWRRFVCNYKKREVASWGRQFWRRTRTRLDGPHGLDRVRPKGRRVVIVAEMRSGSTWFAQRVFGARRDVLYLYEPCRAMDVTRADRERRGRWLGSKCASVVSRLLQCKITKQEWHWIRNDRGARLVYSSRAAFGSFRSFLNLCYSQHVVVKLVRAQRAVAELAAPEALIINVHRPTAEVERSRRTSYPHIHVPRGLNELQTALLQAANVSVSLTEASADPEAVALRMHRLAGMVPVQNLTCARPPRHSWLPCANWSRARALVGVSRNGRVPAPALGTRADTHTHTHTHIRSTDALG
tara:strand:+ start:151 stop:1593 length:1443 start_codon:yes stop_codon:yes gene_type:complete